MTPVPALAQDALLNLLLPVWQMVIGVCVAAAVAVGLVRLVRRGPSRVTAALALVGAALLAVCAVSWLWDSL